MTMTVGEALQRYTLRRRRSTRKARNLGDRSATPIRKVRSRVAHAALEVLNLRRGEALLTATIVNTLDFRYPGLLQGDYRTKYKIVHRALSRVLEVQRKAGRFWLPDIICL